MERIFLLEGDEALGRGIALALQALDRAVTTAPTLAAARDLLAVLAIWPVLVLLPLFALLGVAIPVVTCRTARRHSVVERLRVK